MEEDWESWRQSTAAYYRRRIRDSESVDDLVQEVCSRALDSYRAGRVRELKPAWIHGIRWRVLADFYRALEAERMNRLQLRARHQNVRSMVLVSFCPIPLDEIPARVRTRIWTIDGEGVPLPRLLNLLHESIDELCESWKAVLRDRLRGMSMKQIARSRGLSLNMVRMRLFRGRRKLKTLIRERLRNEEET